MCRYPFTAWPDEPYEFEVSDIQLDEMKEEFLWEGVVEEWVKSVFHQTSTYEVKSCIDFINQVYEIAKKLDDLGCCFYCFEIYLLEIPEWFFQAMLDEFKDKVRYIQKSRSIDNSK